MKRRLLPIAALLSAVLVLTLSSAPAFATPLRLDYLVTPLGGGLFQYDFEFVNDNNDGTWSAGQDFRWFVFGDVPAGSSPLTSFVGDPSSYRNSPYTGFGRTSGGHNGPDLQPVLTDWVPSGVGDSFSFSGTSTADLAQGQMQWSNVVGGSSNPGVRGTFEDAILIPEPTSLMLMALGGLAMLSRRR